VALGWLIGKALTWGDDDLPAQTGLAAVKISYVPWWLALGGSDLRWW